jgi:predicted ferric reductase
MKKQQLLILGSIIFLNVLILALFLINYISNPTNAANFIVRLAALLGLTALFVSTVSPVFGIQLYRLFKTRVIKIHHAASITGLVLITVHPVTFAIYKMITNTFVSGLAVFLPKFDSLYSFWSLAGRPALILLYIALVGALLRNKIKDWWRVIHILNYSALLYGVVHGIIIGNDFWDFSARTLTVPRVIITILFLLMSIAATVFFVLKRVQMAKIRKKKRARKEAKEQTEKTEDNQSASETITPEENNDRKDNG